jgi:hypothetical protein
MVAITGKNHGDAASLRAVARILQPPAETRRDM